MWINYPKQSSFLKACEVAIHRNKKELFASKPIYIKLSPRGYPGKILVSIEETNPTAFRADWERYDPTRFPQRIKVAAYALFRQKCFGEFFISHEIGILTIWYLGSPLDAFDDIKLKPKSYKVKKRERYGNNSIFKTSSRKYYLEKDVRKCIAVAKIIYSQFYESDEGIFGHKDMPEEVLPESVKKGSYEHLMFITLTVSIDYYSKDALELWKASRQTIDDIATCWIYSPDKIIKRSENELINAIQKYRLAKYLDTDLKIWKTVSNSFFKLFNSNPRNLLRESNYDALRVYNLMKSKYKHHFPYLSGNKILPVWIRMMHDVVGIDLKNLDKISIPVDRHVARATLCVGGLTGKYVGSTQDISNMIDEVWKEACASLLYYRLQLDAPLWNLGKYGCTARTQNYCIRSRNCPISQYCVPGKVYVSKDKIEIDT